MKPGARRAGLGTACLLQAGLILLTCDHHDTVSPASPAGLPFEVEYAGCAEVYLVRGDRLVCELPPGESLTLWFRSTPAAHTSVYVDGELDTSGRTPVDGGLRIRLQPRGAETRLRIQASDAGDEATFQLAIMRPDSGWRERAMHVRGAEGLKAAVAHLEDRLDALDDRRRARALGLLAGWSRLTEGLDEAVGKLRHAIDLQRELGLVSNAASESATLAYTLLYPHRRITEARHALHSAPSASGHAPVAFALANTRGMLALETGNLRGALAHLETATRKARRVGLESFVTMSESLRAAVLQRLGRRQEAESILGQLLEGASRVDACTYGNLLSNLVWTRLLQLEAGEIPGQPVAPLAEEAMRIADTRCASMPRERRNTRLNLALAYLHAGRVPEAEATLDEIGILGLEPDPDLRLWELDLRARLALASGEFESSLELYRRLGRLADESLSLEEGWRAAAGSARVLETMGELDAARQAYQRAEDLLSEELLRVPLGQGRDSFCAQHLLASRRFVELLVAERDWPGAFRVARRARARALHSVHQSLRFDRVPAEIRTLWELAMSAYWRLRADLEMSKAEAWRLPANQLVIEEARQKKQREDMRALLDRALALTRPSPRAPDRLAGPDEGELLLGYYAVGDGWVGFAADGSGVVGHVGGALDLRDRPEVLAERLLGPFDSQIEASRTVVLLVPDDLSSRVDLHTLPWRGDALLASREVVYGLDLAHPRGRGEPAGGPGRALVVFDPTGDLPHARREAAGVVRALREKSPPFRVHAVSGAGATARALSDELVRVDLLHFSGHTLRQGARHTTPGLHLADDMYFGVEDVLACASTPPRVVLLACESGTAGRTQVAGLGLAQAFVLRGSREVYATSRPVPDVLAGDLGRLLAEEIDTRGPANYRRAVLTLRAQAPGSDWASLRLFVP